MICRNRGSQSQFSERVRPNRFSSSSSVSSSSSSSTSRRNSASPRRNPFEALSKDDIKERRNRVRPSVPRRNSESDKSRDESVQNGRRPFSNSRGGPRPEDEEDVGGEDFDYDEPAGLHGLRGEEVEIVLPTAPVTARSKPIVCTTGASTELYANPRNCRLVSNPEISYIRQRTIRKVK